jgi:hypothetical protein
MVIFFILTGERPYADAVDTQIPTLVVTGQRPDSTKLPVEYRDLVARCWEHGELFIRGVSIQVIVNADTKKRIGISEVVVLINAIQPMKIPGFCFLIGSLRFTKPHRARAGALL